MLSGVALGCSPGWYTGLEPRAPATAPRNGKSKEFSKLFKCQIPKGDYYDKDDDPRGAQKAQTYIDCMSLPEDIEHIARNVFNLAKRKARRGPQVMLSMG